MLSDYEQERKSYLWLCSSCAGWHYHYCDAQTLRDQHSTDENFVKKGVMIDCPINKYHFIPTKHFKNLLEVVAQFPTICGNKDSLEVWGVPEGPPDGIKRVRW